MLRRDVVSGRQYIPGLDGLRAVAAMMVFGFHAWGHSGRPDLPFRILGTELHLARAFSFGSSGVTLFFVLSGFLLSQPFWSTLESGSKIDLGEYFVRRFLRIYPAYFVVVIICGLFHDTAHPPLARVVQIASHLLLLHNLSEVTVFSISAPLWSVATEFQLYLLLPLLVAAAWAASRRCVSRPAAALGLVLLCGAGSCALYQLATLAVGRLAIDPRLVRPDGFVVAASPLVRLAEFSVGCGFGYLYLLMHKGRHLWPTSESLWWTAAQLVVLAALVVRATLPWSWGGMPPAGWPIVPLLFGALVFLAGFSRSPLRLATLLEIRPLRALGRISYSFYLFQDLVLWNVYNRLVDILPVTRLPPQVCAGLVAFVSTVAIAAASYQLLERMATAAIAGSVRRMVGLGKRDHAGGLART